jgi:CRISPR/Cas system CSM-associated protein Csm3 (group 7 of RAMP superfamily)
MVKAGFDGIAADMLPLVSGCDGQVSLVLPGSSVKGAFRSQAERIVRTVLGDVRPNWLGTEGKKKFLDAVNLSLINELFGAAKQSEGEPHLGLGSLSVMDCFGKPLDRTHWLEIVAASEVKDKNGKVISRADEELGRILKKSDQTKDWQTGYHVAIDRWLGSAAESMLYTVLEPHRTEWEPLTLEVNLQRLPSDLRLPGLALLLLVIRDLANDRLPLGFATHRGMGTVQVTSLEVQGHDLDEALAGLCGIRLQDGRLTNLPSNLNSAWQQWVTQNQEVPA